MSIYRVHIQWKDKELVIEARSLDLTHPYFVSIKDILLPEESSLIINPQADEVRKLIGDAHHLMFPFQKVTLIEELDEKKTRGPKIKAFPVTGEGVDEEDGGPGEGPKDG
ncbi:DUF1820 family protein [Spirochaeta thermophila]|uniref:DUF1820 family protein n=1 Tax=Winmispira thermophila TaxID=154 RepID=UPI0002E88FCF|nr:DUF1820 family protein [Spirochaeta thermophila]